MKGRRDLELHSLLLAADERAGVMADQLAESIHYGVAVAIVERLCAGESADSVASEYLGADAFVGGADEAIRELRASLARTAVRVISPDSTRPPVGQSTAVESRPGSVDAAGGPCPECEELSATMEAAENGHGASLGMTRRLIANLLRAEAEAARLRDELERIADHGTRCACEDWDDCAEECHAIARAALRGEGPE